MMRPLKSKVLRKGTLEGQESSPVTSGFQKLTREPSAQIPVSLHRLCSAPVLPFTWKQRGAVYWEQPSLLLPFFICFLSQPGPRAEGKAGERQSPHTDGAAPSCPAGSESTTAADSVFGGRPRSLDVTGTEQEKNLKTSVATPVGIDSSTLLRAISLEAGQSGSSY